MQTDVAEPALECPLVVRSRLIDTILAAPEKMVLVQCIESSPVRRRADTSCSMALAREVLPEAGRPQVR